MGLTSMMTAIASTVIFLFTAAGDFTIGTAFVLGYPVPGKPGSYVPLIVTAKHVIGDRKEIIGRFSPKNGKVPVRVTYNLEGLRRAGDLWEHPSDGVDIVIFRTPHFGTTDYTVISIADIASKQTFEDEDIKVTDRVIFPSLLVNFMGSSRNYPITRNGHIALIPEEPVPLKYDVGSRTIQTQQEVLFIDGTSVPGASGSPVFLWPGPRLKTGAFTFGEQRPWLLGVMHGFYPSTREIVEIQTTAVVPAFHENSDIAIVFPSWRILEILESDSFSKRIEEVLNEDDKK